MTVDVFDQLTGSDHVKVPLRAAAVAARRKSGGGMTHSWLFTGPPGSGRTNAARAFAMALVCDNSEIVGCGHCHQCRSVEVGSHPDVVWVSTEGMTIAVDDVREVIKSAAKRPMVSSWRVIVVEDADRLHSGAANALLKSVEEPSSQTVFILCAPSTDPQDIAITLRSRCRHIYVPIPSVAEVEQVLSRDNDLGLSPKQISWAARVSGGHIGRARHLAKDETARAKRSTALTLPEKVYDSGTLYRYTGSIVEKAVQEVETAMGPVEEQERRELEDSLGMGAKGKGAAKSVRGSSGQIKDLEKMQKNRRTRKVRDSLDLALVDIAGLYRDAMMIAVGRDEHLVHSDRKGTATELATRNSPSALIQCIDAVMDCRELLKHNVKPEVALDSLAGRLQECCSVV